MAVLLDTVLNPQSHQAVRDLDVRVPDVRVLDVRVLDTKTPPLPVGPAVADIPEANRKSQQL